MAIRNAVLTGMALAIAGLLADSQPVVSQEVGMLGAVPSTEIDMPAVSRGELRFFIDTAGFRGPEGFTRTEVFVLIDAKQLQFIPDKDRYIAQMDLTVTFADTTGDTVEEEMWTRNVWVKDVKGIQQASVPFRDLVRFDLKPGTYRVALSIEDIFGDRNGVAERPLIASDLEGGSLDCSDILLATKIEPEAQEGRFSRHGWQVVPNTTRNYLVGEPLPVYLEFYNLVTGSDPKGGSFVLGYSLTDTSGVPLRRYPTRRLLKPGDSIVKVDTLDTGGLAGGLCYLQVEAFDKDTRQHLRKRRSVYLTAPAVPQELTQEQKDQLRYYSDIRYVATKNVLSEFKKNQTEEQRMAFLRTFWRQLDPTPETPTNERLVEHMRRMRYTENNFSGGHDQEGSDTDKGRVYIQYGPPDDIEYNTGGSGEKPYQIWHYEKEGRSQFVFRDRRGIGVFELVHSTQSGEIYNPSWREEQ